MAHLYQSSLFQALRQWGRRESKRHAKGARGGKEEIEFPHVHQPVPGVEIVERGRKIHEEKRTRGDQKGEKTSLALAPPPPVFPVYNLTRSPTYRRALLSERLEQATRSLFSCWRFLNSADLTILEPGTGQYQRGCVTVIKIILLILRLFPGGGTEQNFIVGRLRHEIQPLTFLYTIFDREGPPSM